ncbi:MAG TPA: hypothetical protein VD969_04730 [Symbiobacteriaceae bacterium]|nr:hypothetical protein [Symbiobacteriaceae bacterium]
MPIWVSIKQIIYDEDEAVGPCLQKGLCQRFCRGGHRRYLRAREYPCISIDTCDPADFLERKEGVQKDAPYIIRANRFGFAKPVEKARGPKTLKKLVEPRLSPEFSKEIF